MSKKPDLVLYYKNENIINVPVSKNWKNYIISGKIYNNFKENIPIGKFRINGSVTNKSSDLAFNEYFIADLPEGQLTWFVSGFNQVDDSGKFIDGQVITCRIVNGSKDFSYATGIVENVILKNPERIAYVYFNK